MRVLYVPLLMLRLIVESKASQIQAYIYCAFLIQKFPELCPFTALGRCSSNVEATRNSFSEFLHSTQGQCSLSLPLVVLAS